LWADDPALLPLDLFLPCGGDAAGLDSSATEIFRLFQSDPEGNGEGPPAMSTATEAANSGTAAPVRCQRIGCDAMFTDDNNSEGSCKYHPSVSTAYPFFHLLPKPHIHNFNPQIDVGRHLL
jgi:hypothetical protein